MNIWILPTTVSWIGNLLLGFWVIFKKRSLLNTLFFLFSMCLATWGFSEFMERTAGSPDAAYLWCRIEGLGLSFFPPLYLSLAVIVTSTNGFKKLRYCSYMGALIFSCLFLFSGEIFAGVVKKFWGYSAVPGRLFPIYGLFYFFSIILGFYILLDASRKTQNKVYKRRNKLIIFAALIPLIIGTITDAIFPMFDIHPLKLAVSSLIVWISLMIYGIQKLNLFGENGNATSKLRT